MDTNTLRTVSGGFLADNVTRDEAVSISDFAHRPVYWGDEMIGSQYF